MNKFLEKYGWIGAFMFISGCAGVLTSKIAHANEIVVYCFGVCTFIGYIVGIIVAGAHPQRDENELI